MCSKPTSPDARGLRRDDRLARCPMRAFGSGSARTVPMRSRGRRRSCGRRRSRPSSASRSGGRSRRRSTRLTRSTCAGAGGRAASRSATRRTRPRGSTGRRWPTGVHGRSGSRVLEGDGVVLTDDISLCTHAGHCADRFTDVWEMIRRTSDPEVRARLQHMVDLCPSGRIAHAADADAEPDEPAFEPSIAVIRDGPLWVRGGIPVESRRRHDLRGPEPRHALPLRSFEQQAVLRRHAQGGRLPRRLRRGPFERLIPGGMYPIARSHESS